MRPVDLIILVMCCVFWGGNFALSAWALGNNPVPPFMLAATRASVVFALLFPFLFRKRPEKFWRLLFVCMCVGPIHLGFLYTGLQTASASASSIISQLLIPLTTILSIIFLNERVGLIRTLGITGALLGTMIMIYEPGALSFDMGLLYIIGAYISLAIGSIMMKTVGAVDWRQYVAWMSVLLLLFMVPMSFAFEQGQADVWANSRVPLLIAAGYAGLAVSIFSHGQYFNLIQKYDVSQVVPLTLLTTLFASIFGVLFLGETLSARMLIGAALILPCVYVIAKRQPS